jgi:hypothetical protein
MMTYGPMSKEQLLAGLRISLARHEQADPQKFSDRMAAMSLRVIIAELTGDNQ